MHRSHSRHSYRFDKMLPYNKTPKRTLRRIFRHTMNDIASWRRHLARHGTAVQAEVDAKMHRKKQRQYNIRLKTEHVDDNDE